MAIGFHVMTRQLALSIRLLLVGCAIALLSGCGGLYSVRPITGRVVDADTGEPLSDVIIVARWQVYRKLAGDDNYLLKVLETVSDASGTYHFTGWGPITLPARADFREGEDPEVSYYKEGYWPDYMSNGLSGDISRRDPPLGEFKGNGQTVALRRWDGKDEWKYYDAVGLLAHFMPNESGQGWKQFPRMTLAIERVRLMLESRRKLPWGFPIPHVVDFWPEDLSVEDKEYLEGFNR